MRRQQDSRAMFRAIQEGKLDVILGAGIGVPVGAIVIILVIVGCWCSKQKHEEGVTWIRRQRHGRIQCMTNTKQSSVAHGLGRWSPSDEKQRFSPEPRSLSGGDAYSMSRGSDRWTSGARERPLTLYDAHRQKSLGGEKESRMRYGGARLYPTGSQPPTAYDINRWSSSSKGN
ncbi:hypothetical protein ScPMuIL_004603 [Solemya velum]